MPPRTRWAATRTQDDCLTLTADRVLLARRDGLEPSGVAGRAPRRTPFRELGHVRRRNEVADRRCKQPRQEDRRDGGEADERGEGDDVPRKQPKRDEEQHRRKGLAHVSEALD